MGINQIDIEINPFRIGFASVPAFKPKKREVDIMSKETAENSTITGKSMVYVSLSNWKVRVFTGSQNILF